MLVKTLKRHRYDKKLYEQGEEYELGSEKHARLLEAVGRIQRIPETIVVAKEEPEKAAKKKAAKKKVATKLPKGRYSRKDMVAE